MELSLSKVLANENKISYIEFVQYDETPILTRTQDNIGQSLLEDVPSRDKTWLTQVELAGLEALLKQIQTDPTDSTELLSNHQT
eukprot:3449206-Amphidinium_carterae.3